MKHQKTVHFTASIKSIDDVEKIVAPGNALKSAKKYGNNLVVNMKTIIDLHDDPARLWWWCDMATKMVDNYF